MSKMTAEEHSRACFTAGHVQYLAVLACEKGRLTEEERKSICAISQKLYLWLMSLSTEAHAVAPPPKTGT